MTKKCLICEGSFVPHVSAMIIQKYCSEECRVIAMRDKQQTKRYKEAARKGKIKSTNEKRKELLGLVKNIGALCPGCLTDYSTCPDRALLMIFERCHYHGRNCERYELSGPIFLACRFCNMEQKHRCGYWRGGKLIEECKA